MVTMTLEQRLPRFVIIGTMKSGTSSLFRWLGQLPGVALPAVKEPNFFCDDRAWRRGIAAYVSYFADVPARSLTGEASVAYTDPACAPTVAARVRTSLPDVRLICVVRDPIERLRSHYIHEVLRGRERRSLVDAVSGQGNPYVRRSHYATALEPWLTAFPREQVLIVRFEDLVRDDGHTWDRITSHLKLSPSPRPEEVHNASSAKPAFTGLMRLLYRRPILRVARAVPSPLRHLLVPLALRPADRHREQLDSAVQPLPHAVEALVRGDVARLPELVGDHRLVWPNDAQSRNSG